MLSSPKVNSLKMKSKKFICNKRPRLGDLPSTCMDAGSVKDGRVPCWKEMLRSTHSGGHCGAGSAVLLFPGVLDPQVLLESLN